jgi:hypothetical protein
MIFYCTGYNASYPFWNSKKNGRELYDYKANKLNKIYLHTFLYDFPETLAILGIPRVLTFRSFEYQAVAIARLLSKRNKVPLPGRKAMENWEREREIKRRREGTKFHDINYETGETLEWLGEFYKIAGLPELTGEGRVPPVLGQDVRWALEHIKKYPEFGDGNRDESSRGVEDMDKWIVVERGRQLKKDLLAFI